ncbi:MAG: phosphoribosylformylglycinamidine synthase subunit PurQ, partial [Candidatus Altiarchaeales archaeon]|nr:phosphoribosylformylglycinamidine synthase subunit PurQ [Candidatus Altiarchaeales archaeon]
MKAAVLFIEGTNCEAESLRALNKFGVNTETVHLKQLYGDCKKTLKRSLLDYDLIYLPGGWSSGDYVRAGAVFAARMKSRIGDQVAEYLGEGKHILGVCNGFQVLVEYGILPGFNGVSENPEAVLTINNPPKFQCRPTYIKHLNPCQLTEGLEGGA